MTTTTAQKVTAKDMLAALYRHFDGQWAMLTEVTARPAPQPVGQPWTPRQRDRRIDVLLVRPDRRTKTLAPNLLYRPARTAEQGTPGLFPPPPTPDTSPPPPPAGPSIERLAIEVKVTRADFLSDVRNPDKQAPWRALAHRHAYAVPAGLVRLDEVPAESGLIEVKFGEPGDRPVVSFARRAPRSAHDPGPMPFPNIMDAFWRTSRLEAEAKGYGYEPHADDDPEALRAEVKRLRHELGLVTEQASRYADKCREWQKRWAAHEPPPCGTCGKPLHIARGRDARIHGHEWMHRDAGDAAMCELLRTAAAEREAADGGYRFRETWVRGPEPVDPAGEAAA